MVCTIVYFYKNSLFDDYIPENKELKIFQKAIVNNKISILFICLVPDAIFRYDEKKDECLFLKLLQNENEVIFIRCKIEEVSKKSSLLKKEAFIEVLFFDVNTKGNSLDFSDSKIKKRYLFQEQNFSEFELFYNEKLKLVK